MSSFLDDLTRRWLRNLYLIIELSVAVIVAAVAICSDGRTACVAAAIGAAVVMVCALRRADTRVRRMLADAYTDPLTGLPTRAVAEHLLRRLDTTGEVTTLAFADADGLKRVNDVHGHPVGDRYLSAVARRLRRAAGDHGSVVRLGGDEFAVFTTVRPEELAEAIDTAMASARMTEYGVRPNASVGIAFTGAGSAADGLLRANAAMHTAKLTSGCTLIYNADRDGVPHSDAQTPWMHARTSAVGRSPQPATSIGVDVPLTLPQAHAVCNALRVAALIGELALDGGEQTAPNTDDVAAAALPGNTTSVSLDLRDLAAYVDALIAKATP